MQLECSLHSCAVWSSVDTLQITYLQVEEPDEDEFKRLKDLPEHERRAPEIVLKRSTGLVLKRLVRSNWLKPLVCSDETHSRIVPARARNRTSRLFTGSSEERIVRKVKSAHMETIAIRTRIRWRICMSGIRMSLGRR